MTDRQIKETTSPGDFIFHEQWMPIFRSFSPEMAGRRSTCSCRFRLWR